ncbi:MAG: glycosyltransferase [Phycisphaerales bacterium]|nr:glycosyltransferase [Phycisphaerales bacterium]
MGLRVLHVVDPVSRSGGPCALRLLADGLGRVEGVEQDVLVLGGTADGELARGEGIDVFHRIAPAGRQAVLASTAMRRFVRRHGPYDVVHAWSIPAYTLVALAVPGALRMLTLTAGPTSRRGAHWLRMALRERPGTVLCASSVISRSLRSCGMSEDVVHVLHPGLDFGRIEHGDRARLREQWGIGESTRVIALVGEPASACDGWRASWILSGLAGVGLDAAVVVPDGVREVHRGYERAARMDLADRFIVDGRAARPWSILPACDAALFLGDDTREAGRGGGRAEPGAFPVLWAMAAGVMVVAEAGYAIGEVLEDHHSALLAKPGDDWGLVRALMRGLTDEQLAWRLRDTVRSEAFSYFSRQRYCSDLAVVYEQVAEGLPVRVPDLPATGGLRFSGRT